MEGRSSFKECPRCGLRNRVSAAKCDFCGYEFKGSDDEWSDYVDILENLGKGDEVRHVDEDLSKKIESTLVKKREVDEVMVEASVAGAGIAATEDREVPEDDVIADSDEPKEVVDFVDSMIEEDVSEPVSEGFTGPEAEIETSEGASLEYMEEPTREEPEAILDTKDSEREERVGWETAAAAALAAESIERKKPELEVSEDRTIDEVPHMEGESGTDEILEVDAEQFTEEAPEILEEIAVEEEPIEGIIPVELEEESPAEVEELPAEPVEAAPPEPAVSLEEAAAEEMAEGTEVTQESSSPLPFAAAMGVGTLLYLVAMGGYIFLSLESTLVWALAILGSVIMVFGFRRFYDVFLPVSEARRRNTGH